MVALVYHPAPQVIQERGKGTYLLVLQLPSNCCLQIGQLGTFALPAGAYLYVGSAFGAGGIGGRLKHHLAPAAQPHWHLDYLRQAAHVTAVYYAVHATRLEHQWAQTLLAQPNSRVPMPRFGASDCRCLAHLVHWSEAPRPSVLSALMSV